MRREGSFRGQDGGGFRGNFAPVKVGDELEVKIEAVGEKGDGIAKKDGFVLFVPNTKEGDNVKIRITRVLRKVGFAEVVGEAEEETAEEETEQAEETEESEQAEEEPEEEPAAEESEEKVEDTEDFGEESKEKED